MKGMICHSVEDFETREEVATYYPSVLKMVVTEFIVTEKMGAFPMITDVLTNTLDDSDIAVVQDIRQKKGNISLIIRDRFMNDG